MLQNVHCVLIYRTELEESYLSSLEDLDIVTAVSTLHL
jgi:hypothetical protein